LYLTVSYCFYKFYQVFTIVILYLTHTVIPKSGYSKWLFIFCKMVFNYYPLIVMIYKYSFSPLLLIIVIRIICVGKSKVPDRRNLCDIFKTWSNRFRLLTDDISSSRHICEYKNKNTHLLTKVAPTHLVMFTDQSQKLTNLVKCIVFTGFVSMV